MVKLHYGAAHPEYKQAADAVAELTADATP